MIETKSQETKQQKSRPGRVTQAAVRRKCLECLNCRTVGYDCEATDCALYRWMPWGGRPMPSR